MTNTAFFLISKLMIINLQQQKDVTYSNQLNNLKKYQIIKLLSVF
jgi:hypothetical protein